MEIQGQFSIQAPQQKVWDFVRNPMNLQPCIPGCQSIEETSPGVFKARIGVKLGPIAPSFLLDIKITEEVAPEYIVCSISGEEGGKASSVSATSRFQLKATSEKSTVVEYFSKSEIVGRLGKYGSGIMKKKADQIWGELADNLRAQLEETGALGAAQMKSEEKSRVSPLWWAAIAILIGGAILAFNN